MKGGFIALLIGIVLLVLMFLRVDIYKRKGTIDIHFHDTYYVVDPTAVIVFGLLFLGTFFSVGGIIGSDFKSKLFWILGVLFLSIDIYYLVLFYRLFNSSEGASDPADLG